MKILMVTPIYPGPGVGDEFTKVVHYFTKEMVSLGHNVRVVAIPSYFPKWMYRIPAPIVKVAATHFGFPLPKTRLDTVTRYEHEGVKVLRVPLYKQHPWAMIQDPVLERASRRIINELESKEFVPDVIAAHWFDPSIYFVDSLKSHFGCKASLVIHNHGFKYRKYIDAPDLWGCRKVDTNEVFPKLFPGKEISFRCCSGIPVQFLEAPVTREWKTCDRFIFVGGLLRRKYPDIVLEALYSIGKPFTLKIVGAGALENKLKKRIDSLGLQDKVELTGRMKRDRIIKLLDNSDVFIMISKDEVFGLVYLEAMARGCIVVAASGEGMEGIIRSGENGFLVPAGNQEKLEQTIEIIREMSPEKRKAISIQASETALKFTERNVTVDYIEHLRNLADRHI